MRSANKFISVVYGILIGGLVFIAESSISGFLFPPLGGVAAWYPFAVYAALTFAMGALSGGLCQLPMIKNTRMAVLGAALCYGAIRVAGSVWWYVVARSTVPDQQSALWVAGIPTIVDLTAFVMGLSLIVILVRWRQSENANDLHLQT